MPRIFDNIDHLLLPVLRETLRISTRADFSVGYFHLRGWGSLADLIEQYQGTDESCCRILVGMHRPPEQEMRAAQKAIHQDEYLDGPTIARLRRDSAQHFKGQIEFGVPTTDAESALRQLAQQLRSRKARVKLFLRYPLHAKLYLIRRTDHATPLIGYIGSSNLSLSGLVKQGELNVDVVEQDAAEKLQLWFNERWGDKYAQDISDELAELIETSWVREDAVSPYHVYLKVAYHLSEAVRLGEREFKMPKLFRNVLLGFQENAVMLAAHYLHRRGGVLLGDVVGLGKTLMACAIAKIFQEDDNSNTLIICPPKLQDMWQWHSEEYNLNAHVLSLGRVIDDLPELRRYRLVVIDESHNLRNRESRRYKTIRDYIELYTPRVLLLTATPYNKQFTDLSNQLRLIAEEDQDLRVRPEKLFQDWQSQGYNEADFIATFQASPRSLRAFEKSTYPDDWRDLMRLFLVRRTRQFILKNYSSFDEVKKRHFVILNGQQSYFPVRNPKTLTFSQNETDPSDQYARLYKENIVKVIGDLALPRYGLANYLIDKPDKRANAEEKKILLNLNRAGRRLIGFSRTNLFKRLESSGYSFLLSIERHILRNMATLYALEQGLPLPIGAQNAAMLDTAVSDEESPYADEGLDNDSNEQRDDNGFEASDVIDDLQAYRSRAAAVYENYSTQFRRRFYWLDPKFFVPDLNRSLLSDAKALVNILQKSGDWRPESDAKLDALYRLIKKHFKDKVLVFTQFADTALYLAKELKARGVKSLEPVTTASADPTALARRFSPASNKGLRSGETGLRVLIATDVLSEGQNLQDAHIVVNFDLPWAIIRLIQRAGRVDRIGQKNDSILVYSFLPAAGVEKIINLRSRLSARLERNQELIGTDESFFGESDANKLRDLYTEKAGALDVEEDEDVDLASFAQQIWNSAAETDRKAALDLPPVIAATRPLPTGPERGDEKSGAIVYLRFPDSTDALVRVDEQGNLISQSLTATFRASTCAPDTPALPQANNHHELVADAVRLAAQEQFTLGGQLGSLRSTRRKVYERLKRYRETVKETNPLFYPELMEKLDPAFTAIYRYPLLERARDTLARQIRLGVTADGLVDMVIRLHGEDSLCNVTEEVEQPEPQIVCSLGLQEKVTEEPVNG